MTRLLITLALGLLTVARPAAAQEPPAASAAEPAKYKSLDELLQRVKEGFKSENVHIKAREAEFLSARDKQKSLLQEALGDKQAAEKVGAERCEQMRRILRRPRNSPTPKREDMQELARRKAEIAATVSEYISANPRAADGRAAGSEAQT